MIYSMIAGNSSDIWEFGFALSEDGVEPVVLANMADGFSCWIKVLGTPIDRAVTAVSEDGKYFRAALTGPETAAMLGLFTVAVELRNPAMVPPLVRESQFRLRVLPGIA